MIQFCRQENIENQRETKKLSMQMRDGERFFNHLQDVQNHSIIRDNHSITLCEGASTMRSVKQYFLSRTRASSGITANTEFCQKGLTLNRKHASLLL
jgi:hypothetical protein